MQEDKHEISKDKDCQDFLAGIKELTRELTQIRERAAIEYTPIVEEFCARKQASENEVGRMLDLLFGFADDERILLMYKKVCRRFVYEYRRRGNSPWIAPAPLTKYLSTTEHEERQVTDSMHLCSQPLYL